MKSLPFIPAIRVEKVEKDSDRDYWMTSQEAKDYGMIDEILQKTVK